MIRSLCCASAFAVVAACGWQLVPVGNQRPQLEGAATIEGIVTDKAGVPISGVAVIAASSEVRSMAITDNRGRYRIGHLQAGAYEVTFDPCQVDAHVRDVAVKRGTIVNADARLGVAMPRIRRLPTPHVAGDDGKPSPPFIPHTRPVSSAARRRLLEAAAADSDELWIIARAPKLGAGSAVKRKYSAGLMCAYVPTSGKDVPLPLVEINVHAKVVAYAASVTVRQSYLNPFREKVEAVYVFPLPENAAVSDFVMTIGSRRIRGIIRDREEAAKIYAEARASGYMAALLTQQRPNVFTQRIANIKPGGKIDIRLTYHQTLPYHDGAYSFVFPTVVGPRYTPSGTVDGIGAVHRGSEGASKQSTEVSYDKHGVTSKRRFKMTVDIDAGLTIEAVESDSHAVRVERLSATRRRVTLAKGKAIPNRDFVLRYRVAGESFKSGLMVHKHRGDKYFSLLLQPPRDASAIQRRPLDVVFVVDTSDSMRGEPLARAKTALRQILSRLKPHDTVSIIPFGGSAKPRPLGPLAATPANGVRMGRYIDRLTAAFDTDALSGLTKALAQPAIPGRTRLVAFISDGYMGNERAILAAIHRRVGAARIFGFGVGSAVNRFLFERVARLGHGTVAYVGADARAARVAVDAFFNSVSRPVLADIELDFDGARVKEIYPRRIPDLFVGRPVVITGKFEGAAPARVRIRGRLEGRRVAYSVPVAGSGTRNHPQLAKVWARMKIADLYNQAIYARDRSPLHLQMKSLAAKHGLMSPFTDFMAVDTASTDGKAAKRVIRVPVPLPRDVRDHSAIKRKPRGGAHKAHHRGRRR